MTTTNMLKAALLAVLIPAALTAQERPLLEIGTKGGFSLTSYTGDIPSLKAFSLPTGLVYLAFFPTDNLFVEPELSLDWLSDGDDSVTSLGMTGWISYAPAGVAVNSVYFGAGPALQYVKYGESNTELGASGRVGYRSIVRESLAVRIEGGFTRWFDDEINVFSVQVGVGGLVKRAP